MQQRGDTSAQGCRRASKQGGGQRQRGRGNFDAREALCVQPSREVTRISGQGGVQHEKHETGFTVQQTS